MNDSSSSAPTFKYAPLSTYRFRSQGRLPQNDRDGYDVRVTDHIRDRAAKFFRVVIDRVLHLGFDIDNGEENGKACTFCVDGDARVTIQIRQVVKQQHVKPDPDDLVSASVIYVPEDSLIFRVGHREIRETKRWKIEERIEKIVGVIETEMAAAKVRAAKAEENRKRAAVEAEERAERLRIEAEENRRFGQLRQDAFAWREAQVIREYLAALRERLERDGVEHGAGSEAGEFLAWAEGRLAESDPLEGELRECAEGSPS